MIVLALYPLRLVSFTVTHLVTVTVGDVLLLAPMPALLRALVPEDAGHGMSGAVRPPRASARGRWWAVAALGIAVGAFAIAGR